MNTPFEFAARAAVAVLTLPLLLGCGDDSMADGGAAAPAFTADALPPLPPPESFSADLTNPYLAFETGRKFHYETLTDEGLETNLVEVTNQTQVIAGVTVRVVHDLVYLNGDLIEDTLDWYAEDQDGNVWYFGEDTKQILNGEVVGTEGSWTAGIEGPPGIIMLAEPELGMKYKQEDATGIAEDMGKVVGLSEQVVVPYGTFEGCLKTAEWSLLESGPRDFKFYAPGIGLVLEIGGRGRRERVELTAID